MIGIWNPTENNNKSNNDNNKTWNPALLEIQYPESGIHSVESRIQDCHEFPYMGR